LLNCIKLKKLPKLFNMIKDNVRNLSDEDLFFFLGNIKNSADTIEAFVEDPVERQELLNQLYDQYKDFIDEFKRRQRVFDVKPS